MLAWHGTAETSLASIYANGFNSNHTKAVEFGKGVYFSVDPVYSSSSYYAPRSKGRYFLILASITFEDYFAAPGRAAAPVAKRDGGTQFGANVESATLPRIICVTNDSAAWARYVYELSS